MTHKRVGPNVLCGCLTGITAGHLTRRFECTVKCAILRWWNGMALPGWLPKQLWPWFISYDAKQICVNCARCQHGAETLNEHWLVWKKNIGVKSGLINGLGFSESTRPWVLWPCTKTCAKMNAGA